MTDMFLVKPCKTGATYEVLPKKILELKDYEMERALRRIGYKIKACTPYVVVAEKETEVSLFPSGRILVKELKDETKVRKLAKEIYETL